MRARWVVGGIIVAALMTKAVLPRGSREGSRDPQSHLFVVQRGDVVVVAHETGTIEPFSKVEVKSKVGGRILRMPVQEGERVSRGQLLAEIDPVDYQSQVNADRAVVAVARAHLDQAVTALGYQITASRLEEADADQGVHTAQARLYQAQAQNRAQPLLTNSAIAQAAGNLQAAEAALAALKQSTHPQLMADSRSGYAQAQATAENAGRQLHRLQALLAKGYVPQNQVDDAQRDYDNDCAARDSAKEKVNTLDQRMAAELHQAEAQVAQMRAALDSARASAVQDRLRADDVAAGRAAYVQARTGKERAVANRSQVDVKRADVEAARATVQQLENQFAQDMVHLRDTTILAPMAGIVTRRYVQAGELVTSGITSFSSGTPILQIGDLSHMRVACDINEVDVESIHVGQHAEITLDAARGQRYPGEVVSIAPSALTRAPGETGASAATSNIAKFEVKTALHHADHRLKPGMNAEVDIFTAERRNVLTLPIEAVDMSSHPARVTLVQGGKTLPVEVQTGLKNDTTVEILSGLHEGDRVLPAAYHGVPRKGVNLQVRTGQNGSSER